MAPLHTEKQKAIRGEGIEAIASVESPLHFIIAGHRYGGLVGLYGIISPATISDADPSVVRFDPQERKLMLGLYDIQTELPQGTYKSNLAAVVNLIGLDGEVQYQNGQPQMEKKHTHKKFEQKQGYIFASPALRKGSAILWGAEGPLGVEFNSDSPGELLLSLREAVFPKPLMAHASFVHIQDNYSVSGSLNAPAHTMVPVAIQDSNGRAYSYSHGKL